MTRTRSVTDEVYLVHKHYQEMYLLASGGDLLQREAVLRLKWLGPGCFYEVMRMRREQSEKRDDNAGNLSTVTGARTHAQNRAANSSHGV